MMSESTATTPTGPWPADVAGLLARAEEALRAGDPKRAFGLLPQAKAASPWAANALGVCLLRLGDLPRALEVFRGLALAGGGFGLRHEAPTAFKTNYATAQLLAGNLTGCVVTLAQVRDEAHPSVRRLRAAIHRWQRSLSFVEKVRSFFGGDVGRPVELDFPPGDL